MAANLTATFDTRKLDKYVKELKGLPKLQSQALNEAARTVRTDTARKIREHTSAKAALVKNKLGSKGGGGLMITKRASPISLYTQITGSKLTSEMNKTYFSVSARKATKNKPPRATIKLKGRRVVFRDARLSGSGRIRARGEYRGGQFHFEDDVTKRGVYTRLRTFSVASQLNKPYIATNINAVSFAAYEKAFVRALKRKKIV